MLFEILDQRLIYYNPGRVLNNDVIMTFLSKVDPMPEMVNGQFNILIDHSLIQRVELSNDSYRNWALTRQKVDKDQQPYKVAIYSSSQLGFGMARMFEAFHSSVETPVLFSVFSDLDEALDWLEAGRLKKRILSLSKRAAIPLKAVGDG